MQQEQEKNLTERKIPFTFKELTWMVGAVLTIVIAVIGGTYKIISSVEKQNANILMLTNKVDELQKNVETKDIKLQTLDLNMRTILTQNAVMDEQIKNLKNK